MVKALRKNAPPANKLHFRTSEPDFVQRMKASGARMTPARSGIAKIISEAEYPLSAAQILTLLSFSGISVNRTTVYREIAFLTELGLLSEVHTKEPVVLYESKELPHHHHLICERCGKISDIENPALEKSISGLKVKAGESGFTVREHKLELYGTCRRCRQPSVSV